MSGGGGGVGGPTVSHEPGVRNEPLLIAGVLDTGQLFVNVTGQQPAKTVHCSRSINSSDTTNNGALPLVDDCSCAVRDPCNGSVRRQTHCNRRPA